jgi:hypothetical protein
MGHEFTHASDFEKGRWVNVYNSHKLNGASHSYSKSQANSFTEKNAHGWQISHSAPVNIKRFNRLMFGWLEDGNGKIFMP